MILGEEYNKIKTAKIIDFCIVGSPGKIIILILLHFPIICSGRRNNGLHELHRLLNAELKERKILYLQFQTKS